MLKKKKEGGCGWRNHLKVKPTLVPQPLSAPLTVVSGVASVIVCGSAVTRSNQITFMALANVLKAWRGALLDISWWEVHKTISGAKETLPFKPNEAGAIIISGIALLIGRQ